MAGLILKLRPGEELMINGVLIENGDRNTRLRVKTIGANILRLRDALKPEEATTPLKRAYYIAQLAVAGQITNVEAASILKSALNENTEMAPADTNLSEAIESYDFYGIMRALKTFVLADRQTVLPTVEQDASTRTLKAAE
ncbi:flagellar biosynthesis repressor FlbT [Hyphococcus lacteus]|uniref:Flagellar biosynthesis repressor FlbT n=1 Tax=Hyphococcus lacteus TaxID=3143536 RepID=A0ABV3Z216_9PROT